MIRTMKGIQNHHSSAIVAVSIGKQYAFSRNAVESKYVLYQYGFKLSVYSDQGRKERILAMHAI